MFLYLNGRRVWTELQEADSGGNNGGGDSSDKAEAAFKRLLEKHNNDAAHVAGKLFDENYQYREKIRQLERQVAETQGKLPADGTLVLSAEDSKRWQAYQTLGEPDAVKQGLDERTKLQGDLAVKERESLLRSVADVTKWKPTVLSNLDRIAKAEGKELEFIVREVTVDGKPVKAAFVKEGDKETPAIDYATSAWADFLPALTTVQADPPPAGTRHVTQHHGSSTQGAPDLVTEYLQRQEKARAAEVNPLLPKG